MKMNTLFFIFLTGLVSVLSSNAHAMFMTQRAHKAFVRGQRLYASEQVRLGEIQDYSVERDENYIAPIALKYMDKLTSEVIREYNWSGKLVSDNRLEVLDKLMPGLASKAATTKVYLIDGKAVGFINYYIDQDGWDLLLPCLGPTANINYLAVDENYQGQGIGDKLLKYALQDCQNQSVSCITLSTTGLNQELGKYYEKYGFNYFRESKSTGVTLYKKRLKPHPAILISMSALEWLKKRNGE